MNAVAAALWIAVSCAAVESPPDIAVDWKGRSIRPGDRWTHEDLFRVAQTREERPPLNGVYRACFDQIEKSRGFVRPERDWVVDDFMLLHAQRLIVERADVRKVSGALLKSRYGFEIPAGLFSVFHRQLKAAYGRRFEIDDAAADALAAALEKQAVEIAGVDYRRYLKASGRQALGESARAARVKKVFEFLATTSVIDTRFDVPFVAGYDFEDGKHIFIDKGVPESFEANGKAIAVWKLLNVHERVEKALLDEFQLQYQTAHQIALRTERASAQAIGADWTAYDERMKPIIDRLDMKKLAGVSDRLDMMCYYSYSDPDNKALVERMQAAMVHEPLLSKP